MQRHKQTLGGAHGNSSGRVGGMIRGTGGVKDTTASTHLGPQGLTEAESSTKVHAHNELPKINLNIEKNQLGSLQRHSCEMWS